MKGDTIMKKILSTLFILVLISACLTGCGSADSSKKSAPNKTSEETTDNSSQKGAIKARVEMDDYQIHLDSPGDTTLHGTINHSFGQDIVALNEEGKEIARISLKGNDGDEESFSIVIPASAITKKHNPTRIKGTELSRKVLETNTKMVSINMGNE